MSKCSPHSLTKKITYRFKTYILIVLLSTLTLPLKSRAEENQINKSIQPLQNPHYGKIAKTRLIYAWQVRESVTVPLKVQVQQAAHWFTGLFNNSEQVANNPSVPVINMSNCAVRLNYETFHENTQNVYVEQTSTLFNRIRLYSFSQGDSTVTLKIRSFVNSGILSGICNRPLAERVIDNSNVIPTSCDLELKWEPRQYVGNNAPGGCITSSNYKVVSNVEISRRYINSLDQIFDANGNLIANTPIKFRRVSPTSPFFHIR